MRQGQNSKRSRGRGAGRRNVPPRHQTFDSNGPSVRIRGSAHQVHEKYLALARDAGSAGDRIAAENYLQHAEHYFRIINMDNDGEGRNRGRGQQNGSGRGPVRDGQDEADAAAPAGASQPDGEAPAPEAEVVQTNGSGEQPDIPPQDADHAGDAEEPAAPPKRKTGRGNGRGRSPRASSKAAAPTESNGTDAGDEDNPPAED
jgi:hypothetical protein